MHIHRLELAGVTLAVREWPGGERPLLAWHALGPAASGAFAEIIAERLGANGLRTFAVDAPGFGESSVLPTVEYTVDGMADLLLGAVGELRLERPVLVGHSWGAAVVLEAARRNPAGVGGVALLDAGHADYADWPTAKPAATVEELVDAARAGDEIAASWAELEAEVRAAYPGVIGCSTSSAPEHGSRRTAACCPSPRQRFAVQRFTGSSARARASPGPCFRVRERRVSYF